MRKWKGTHVIVTLQVRLWWKSVLRVLHIGLFVSYAVYTEKRRVTIFWDNALPVIGFCKLLSVRRPMIRSIIRHIRDYIFPHNPQLTRTRNSVVVVNAGCSSLTCNLYSDKLIRSGLSQSINTYICMYVCMCIYVGLQHQTRSMNKIKKHKSSIGRVYISSNTETRPFFALQARYNRYEPSNPVCDLKKSEISQNTNCNSFFAF